ncbi:helix-turn-helix domain-containing protein [Listeria booriae]|uniref:helix-turn-helix domain-containing protein n=1 Tax=Listeria booriae TaxID=1552123 RepID=UPI002880520A|nr:helix-turn-helix domain-containing protein [Listeria booriae]MDT0110969.1 helix-turn-helix domain-containing protein [Listeria booriae]
MDRIISASADRMLTLLHILFVSKNGLSRKDIANKIGCSPNTLAKDIAKVNTLFPKKIAHINTKGKLLILDTGISISFDYLIAYTISTSDLFSIGYSIFNNEQKTAKNWMKEKYIGSSSLYNKLQEMDDFLEKSRLTLNRNPFQILGNERNIRFLFYHWFNKCFPYTGWIIKDFKYNDIDRFIQKLEAHLHITFSLSARMDYAQMIGVSLTRIKQGYMAESEEETDSIQDLEDYFELACIDFVDLERPLQAPLSKIERHWILLTCTFGSFSYVDHSRIDLRIAYHKKHRQQRYQLGFDLASIMKGKTIDFDRLTVVILDYLTRFTFVQKKHLLTDVGDYTENSLPNTAVVRQITAILKKYEKIPGYKYIRDNREIITLYINELFLYVALNEVESQIVHIQVISKKGFFWESYLKSVIRKHFTEQSVLFCDAVKPNENPFNIHYLILCDFPIQMDDDIDVMVWNMPPIHRDILQLQTYLDNKKKM